MTDEASYMVRSPILVVAFNRPELTRRVLESVRQARPSQLHFAVDGPRVGREDDQVRCAQVRELADTIDWPCDLRTLFRDENLGCRSAVHEAVSWFLGDAGEGIILEDDIVCEPSFYQYCDVLLDRYRSTAAVGMVSGFTPAPNHLSQSYAFSRYAMVWGWATWARAWEGFDAEFGDAFPTESPTVIADAVGQRRVAARYWRRVLGATYKGAHDSWAYPWLYTLWRRAQLCAIPSISMVRNIGFGAVATHTIGYQPPYARQTSGQVPMPIAHPNEIVADKANDERIERAMGITLSHELARALMSNPIGRRALALRRRRLARSQSCVA